MLITSRVSEVVQLCVPLRSLVRVSLRRSQSFYRLKGSMVTRGVHRVLVKARHALSFVCIV
jgi:hypothetical protein